MDEKQYGLLGYFRISLPITLAFVLAGVCAVFITSYIYLTAWRGELTFAAAVLGGAAPFQPVFLFVALGDTGKIDVIDMVARVKITTIDVPGVNLLATYWRQ